MADLTTTNRLRSLVLSATEIKALTDWPDALVEDYLNIVDNLLTIAEKMDERVLKELSFPLEGIGKGATAPTITRLGNTYGYAFTIGDDGYVSFEVPLDWDETTTIEIKIHMYINEAFALSDAATKWQATWSVVPEGVVGIGGTEPIDGATHTGTLTSANTPIPATAKCLQEISLGAIAVASLAAHDNVFLLISRIASDTVDPAAEPVIVDAEYEWTANKLGEAI